MAKAYTTINNVINEYVAPALGSELDNFDAMAIAHDIAEYQPELNGFTIDEEAIDFWGVVARHEIQA